MSNPFTFEAQPYELNLPTSERETGGRPESSGNPERFLGDLWGAVTGPRIVDRTAFTPRDKRKATRAPGKFYALVLHQMACAFADLLRTHIHKEDMVLYPMARRNLSDEAVTQMATTFADMEGFEDVRAERALLVATANALVARYL